MAEPDAAAGTARADDLERLRRELTAVREQLAATSEVLTALGRSASDPDIVLDTIVTTARKLCRADVAQIYLVEGDWFRLACADGLSEQYREWVSEHPMRLDRGTLAGRVALDRHTQQIEDVLADSSYGRHDAQRHGRFRTTVGAPMLLDDDVVGVLLLWRYEVDPFGERFRAMITTFAAQAAIAIRNVELLTELQAKGTELEVASRHKSEFLASMSHELRTPLNAVLGFSEVLLERMFGDINERQEEYLRDIWNSGKHLLELLNEILDLSKVEAGRMELDVSTFAVRSALEYGVSLVRDRAALHAIEVTLICPTDVGLIACDELRFKQVALNLLSNAVKFTPDGGRVSVRAERGDRDVQIEVTDTGTGIPPEDRERIFESFQQGGRGAAREEGTGLGLTLSRRLVDLFGGRLWLDSEVGVGSTFAFSVPVGLAVVADGRSADDVSGLPLVVIVEDDRASVDLLTAYLEGVSIEVVTARDGPDGLDVVRRLSPSAVLLDIRLPRMDGWDVLAALKADEATASIPVVVVSIVDERSRGMGLGASAYLTKPVRRDDLLSALAAVNVLPASLLSKDAP